MGDMCFYPGDSRVLVVAPHGFTGDDDGTAEIAERIFIETGCSVLVNRKYRRPNLAIEEKNSVVREVLDLNRTYCAKIFPEYEDVLETTVMEKPEITTVLWLHGITDTNIWREAQSTSFHKDPSDLKALIGIGQCSDKDKPLTMRISHAIDIALWLSDNGLGAALAKRDSHYSAMYDVNMTQWFTQNDMGHRVDSLQLEMKKTGVRDKNSITKTSGILSRMVQILLSPNRSDEDTVWQPQFL